MSTAKPNQENDCALETLRDGLRALKAGDFSVRVEDSDRLTKEVAAAFNDVAAMLDDMARARRSNGHAALEEKAKQLALSSKQMSEVLAKTSHEMRTPLNSLLMLSQLLADNPDGNLAPRQVEFARTIHAAGTDLLALTNDILDHTRMSSGAMRVESRELRLDTLPTYVDRNFRALAEQKRLSIETVLAPSLPPVIVTDPRRLLQVLNNLLANALKFTEEGRISLTIAVANEGWSKDRTTLTDAPQVIAFSVRDTGIGIPNEDQQRIFEAFQQGATSRAQGGIGLGLSNSRELATLLGGELRVHSVPGAGSNFTLYLPEALVAQPDVSPAPRDGTPETILGGEHISRPRADDRAFVGKTVLVVDDDVRHIFAVTTLLERQGVRVLFAENGRQGIETLQANPAVQLVLMDLMMPEMDGYEATRKLRNISQYATIPIIVLTAKAMKDERGKCIAVGASDYIAKPVDADKLLSVLRVWMY